MWFIVAGLWCQNVISMLYVRMLFLCFNLDAWSSPALTSSADSQLFMSLHHVLVESLDCVVYILSHHVLSCFISCFYLISFIYPVCSSVSQSIHSLTCGMGDAVAAPMPQTGYDQSQIMDGNEPFCEPLVAHQPRQQQPFQYSKESLFVLLPSSPQSIAHGLTSRPIAFLLIPFFVGRLVSYTFWVRTASTVVDRLDVDVDWFGSAPYFIAYYLSSQLLLISFIYTFTS